MKKTIAVVGAGISGLLLARELRQRGADVVVLEKSRGVGGRLATKRVGSDVFDQGAQYFTTRNPRFLQQVEGWREQGAIKPWPGAPAGRWIGRGGMTAIAKAVAADGVEVLREHRVTRASRHECGCWELDIENHGVMRAERLVLSAPVPQSLAILDAGAVTLPGSLRAELEQLTYHPCLALLLALDGPSAVPAEGVAISEGGLRWVADNTQKSVSPGPGATLTVHAAPAFAAEHYGLPVEEVFARLETEIKPWLGAARIVSTTLHRWRYSEPKTTFRDPCVWLPELTLGFCGDAFGGPRVEGAAVSGLALADQLSTVLTPA